jgi:acyl carrier protein
MDEGEALAALTEVFRDVFDDQEIVLARGTTAADIEEWDSLNQVRLLLACEKRFGVRLRPRDINALANVGEMVDHLLWLARR